jgi:hypothetical protein
MERRPAPYFGVKQDVVGSFRERSSGKLLASTRAGYEAHRVYVAARLLRRFRREATEEAHAATRLLPPRDAADEDSGLAIERQNKLAGKYVVRRGDAGPQRADITHHAWMKSNNSPKRQLGCPVHRYALHCTTFTHGDAPNEHLPFKRNDRSDSTRTFQSQFSGSADVEETRQCTLIWSHSRREAVLLSY